MNTGAFQVEEASQENSVLKIMSHDQLLTGTNRQGQPLTKQPATQHQPATGVHHWPQGQECRPKGIFYCFPERKNALEEISQAAVWSGFMC